MSHQGLFLRQFFADFFHIGAILPSSRSLARAAVAYLAQKQGPARVLEAGAGTGAFTREIVPLLQPGDTMDVVEINPKLMATLRRRFELEFGFQTPEDVAVNLITNDVRHVARNHQYDYIVFSLPLTNFPPALVQELLELMMAQLKPGGVFSYVHYIFISRFKYLFGGSTVKAEMQANRQIIGSFAARYQIQRRAVWLNIPPSWVYFWQKPG
ncbi:MAG: methyltransferase domain-containing protein [Anaerolineae bacterium]|nr:methyltransferase domain-containing protein [Anaerolineae bacterium]